MNCHPDPWKIRSPTNTYSVAFPAQLCWTSLQGTLACRQHDSVTRNGMYELRSFGSEVAKNLWKSMQPGSNSCSVLCCPNTHGLRLHDRCLNHATFDHVYYEQQILHASTRACKRLTDTKAIMGLARHFEQWTTATVFSEHGVGEHFWNLPII